MKRFSGYAFIAFGMIVLLVWPGAAIRPAEAAPLPAPFTAQASSSVARVSTDLLGISVADLGLVVSEDVTDSQATPRVSAGSSNVDADVLGLPISVSANTNTAPPDDPAAETGALLGVNAGILSLGALTYSNLARWTGDDQCVPSETFSESATQTAGLNLTGLLSTGVSSSSTSTGLSAGTGTYNRAVTSTASGSLAGVSALGGLVTITVSESPVITAEATGVAGTASVTRNNPVVTVTGPNGSSTLQLGAQAFVDVTGLGLASVVVTLNPPAVSESADGLSASATWDFLEVQVETALGLTSADVSLLPLAVSATAPTGGIDCPPPAPVIEQPAEGEATGPLPTISGTAEPNASVTLTLDGTELAPVTADASGDWSYAVPPGSELAEGSHEVTATQTVNGAESPPTPVRTFVVDLTAPDAPVVTDPADGSSTNDTTPTYVGTAEADSSVEVFVDGASIGTTQADGDGNWTIDGTDPLGAGDHTVYATATDAVGNVSPDSDTNTFTVDLVAPGAPVVVEPADGDVTSDATPTYVGTAEADATVEVFVDGASIGTTTADGAGDWTLDQPADLADGDHTVSATATDPAGNVSADSNTNTFTVDTTGPAAPVIVEPADGSSTNDTTPTYVGTAEPNSSVEVFVDGASIGTTPVDGAGDWSIDQPAELAEGDHVVTAQGTDALGNAGPESAETDFTVDLTAPAAPVVVEPADGSSTNDTTPTYVGTAEPDATVEVLVDGASIGTTTADGAGDWSIDQPADLAEGEHTVSATATDAAGNVSADSNTNTFTVDLTAPDAPVVLEPADGSSTNDTTPTYVGTAEPDSSVEVFVDGASIGTTTADGAGDWSIDQPADLAEGEHTVSATATDAAGNVSPSSNTNTFTVDVTGPAAPVIIEPADGDVTSDSTPTYVGTAEPGATVEVFVDGASVGTTTADGAGDWSLDQPTDLADGDHVVAAQATDEAGNTGPMSGMTSFVVDTAAPLAPIVTDPADGSSTNDTTPTYVGTAEPDSSVEVFVDGASIGTTSADGAGDWSIDQPADLAEGEHTVFATATDAAGNVSPDSDTNTFTVDTVAPEAPVVTAPADGSTTADATPTYVGTAEADSTVEVFVDGASIGTTTADGAGDWSIDQPADLAEGEHTVFATATDAAGNVSPDSDTNTFTVDTVAPEAPVVVEPADGDVTSDATPTYVGTAEADATVEVFVDGASIGTTTADGAGDWSIDQPTDLAEGDHTVSATATDAAGNVSPSSNTNTFTVDTVAPEAPVVVEPADGASTNDTTPTYVGTAEPDATVEVFVDGASIGTTTADGAGDWSIDQPADLAEGDHAVYATATDAAGNVSPDSDTNTFTVDLTAPDAPVVTAPADGSSTNDTTPTYVGTAEPNATVEVFVDDASIGTTTADGAGDWSIDQPADLAEGDHAVYATATDAAGNVSPDSDTNTFTVDVTGPDAPVIVEPADGSTTADATPTYVGTADPGSTVEVTVDGTPVGTTTADGVGDWSLDQPTALADGPHTVTATATDEAGNESPVSDTTTFTVDTTAPDAPVITSPTGTPTYPGPDVTVTGTGEPGAALEVTATSGGLTATASTTVSGAGTWSVELTGLAEGTWTAVAEQTDAVGNVSDESDPESFVVDSTAPEAPVIDPFDPAVSSDATPTITGTGEPGAEVTVTDVGTVVTYGPVTVAGDGTWSVTVPDGAPLEDGTHTFTATQEDAGGNVSGPSAAEQYTVDTTAPAAPVIALPADGSTVTDPTPTVSGTAEPGSTVTVLVDGEPVGTTTASGSGSWTFPLTTPLVDGPHTASATATDAVGNVSPATTNAFVVDTSAATPVVTSPEDGSSTNDTTPTISGTADPGDLVTVTLDGVVYGTVTADEDGRWSLTPVIPLLEGPHTVTAQARDAVGNVSAVSSPVTFTVDVTAPEPPVIVTPEEGETTDDPTPEVTGTGEPGATVTVTVDGTTVGTTVVDEDGSWSVTVPNALGNGSHVVTATQTDAAGNVSDPDSVRFSVQAAVGSGGGTPPAGGSTGGGTGGSGGSLAQTGSELLPLAGFGLVLLCFGIGLSLASGHRGRPGGSPTLG
ncbi:hypothetical protein KC207_10480 [Phycicoccus sp. BSK3Z-2]|uniref:Uncharacterized protein n=1 Tax=Phycicoccus avicenniae TaxID=2828860 RepID=A0A941DAA0_9MICO|nr:Ig-like domain-containing protein [Phycicoccus avicenniae]MBR7743715.1 hypothetical protein [Phycicoccus avicenniae]